MRDRYSKENVRHALDAREVAKRYNLHGKATQRGHWHTFRCVSPDHHDNKPSMGVSQHGFKCRSCGFSGDVFDLVATLEGLDTSRDWPEVLEISAQLAGVDPLYYITPSKKRAPSAARPTLNDTPTPDRSDEESIHTRARIHKEIWRILRDLPLTHQASAFFQGRSLAPDAMHRLGARDPSLATAQLRSYLDGLTHEELEGAGLWKDEKLWWPLRRMLDGKGEAMAGVMLPLYWPGYDHPMGWRWRMLSPYSYVDEDGAIRTYKALGHGTSGRADILGMHLAANAHTVIVCEGEPDYLSAAECVEGLEGVEVIGICAITASDAKQGKWLEELAELERVVFAIHRDIDKRNGARAPLEHHGFYGKGSHGSGIGLAEGLLKAHGRLILPTLRSFRVLDVEGERDLNDLHQEGLLKESIARWLDFDITPKEDLSEQWRALVDAIDGEDLAREIEDAEKGARRRARERYINPLNSPEVIDLDSATARIVEEVEGILEQGGTKAIAITPGSGKTTATAHRLTKGLLSHEIDVLDWASPSIDVRDEVMLKLRQGLEGEGVSAERAKLEAQMKPVPTRNKATCPEFDIWVAASRANPNGGNIICQGCERGPHNASGEGLCGFWQEVNERGGGGRARLKSHQKFTLEESHIAGYQNPKGVRGQNKPIRIAWKQAAEIAREGGNYKPFLREAPTQLVLELAPANSAECTPLDPLDVITNIDDDGKPRYQLSDDGKTQLLSWFATALECGETRDDVCSAARARGIDQRIKDVLVIDEFLDSLRIDVTATLEDLDWLRQHLPIPQDAFIALLDLLAESQKREPHDPRRHTRITGEQIANAVKGLEIDVIDLEELQAEEVLAASVMDAGFAADRLALLGECKDWRLIPAFYRAVQNGFAECHMQGGILHMALVRRIDFGLWRSVIALDATLSKNTAMAMFGPDVEHVQLEIERPEHVHIAWVRAGLGKSSARGGKFQRERARDLFDATHTLFDGPDTVFVTQKAWRPESIRKQAEARGEALDTNALPHTAAFFQNCEGQVIHHNGPQRSGWNGAENCRVMVVDSYYPNSSAIRSTAFTLCELAEESWRDGATRSKWLDEARWLLEGRLIVQIIERIRTIRATADRPVTVVIISERNPEALGYAPDITIEPDQLIFRASGVVRGPEGVADAVRAALLSGKGVWCPNLDEDTRTEDHRKHALELATRLKSHEGWPFVHGLPEREVNMVLERMMGMHSASNKKKTLCPESPTESQSAGFLCTLHTAQFPREAQKKTPCEIGRMESQSAGFLCRTPLYSQGVLHKNPAPSHSTSVIEEGVSAELSTVLRDTLRNHFGGSLERFCEVFDIGLVRGITGTGGRPCAILCDHALPTDVLLERIRGFDAFEVVDIDGERLYIEEEYAWRLALRDALVALDTSPETMSFNELAQAIADIAPAGSILSGSRDRAKEAIRQSGRTAGVRAFWRELHPTPDEAPKPPPTEPATPTRSEPGETMQRESSTTLERTNEASNDYTEATRQWRAWCWRAPGDLMRRWPDEATWRDHRRRGLSLIAWPDEATWQRLLARPGGEMLPWMRSKMQHALLGRFTLPPGAPSTGEAIWEGWRREQILTRFEDDPHIGLAARRELEKFVQKARSQKHRPEKYGPLTTNDAAELAWKVLGELSAIDRFAWVVGSRGGRGQPGDDFERAAMIASAAEHGRSGWREDLASAWTGAMAGILPLPSLALQLGSSSIKALHGEVRMRVLGIDYADERGVVLSDMQLEEVGSWGALDAFVAAWMVSGDPDPDNPIVRHLQDVASEYIVYGPFDDLDVRIEHGDILLAIFSLGRDPFEDEGVEIWPCQPGPIET